MSSSSPERHLVLARLRDDIRRLERRPARRDGWLACGRAEVDAALPDGGFPRGALSELAGGPASGKAGVALSLLSRLGADDLFAWVDGRGELYPPAAAALGVDLARLLVVRPAAGLARGGDPLVPALWAAEALLGSGAFGAVVIDAPAARITRGADAAARRLQAAAEKGGAVGLWLSAPGSALRIPAAVRLELSAEHGRVVARRIVARQAQALPQAQGERALRDAQGRRAAGDARGELRVLRGGGTDHAA